MPNLADITDKRLQDFALEKIAQSFQITLDGLLQKIAHFLKEPSPSDRDQEYWVMRSVAVLRQMHEKQEWIKCLLGQTSARVELENRYDLTLVITDEGREHLSRRSHPQAGSPNATQEQFKHTVAESISELVRKYHYVESRSERKARERIAQAILTRRGQQKFRHDLISTYGKCLVTGCEAELVLEAAHIRPYCGGGTFDVSNGLLLRADIHTLFDLDLIAIDTERMTVIVAPKLANTSYSKYAGKQLLLAERVAEESDKEALDKHREDSGL